MSPDNLLPEDDRDLQLAQQIQRSGFRNQSMEQIDDPLMPLLLQYRKNDNAELNQRSPNTSTIWTGIEAGIHDQEPRIYHLFTRSDTFRWIAAAAVVIIALSTFFWLFERNQPDLIASSTNTVSTVILQDGSVVTLRPYSSLHEISYSESEQIYSVSGEAYFEVDTNPARTFIAETDDGRVVVLGTKFVLQNWNDRTSVFLEEGRIRFETLDQASSALLEPGESSSISDNVVMNPVEENISVYKDWLENTLVLENQPVSLVLSEIEQHFNVAIESEETPEETLGGSIRLDNVDQVLQDLSVVLGGRFEQVSENRYKYIPPN